MQALALIAVGRVSSLSNFGILSTAMGVGLVIYSLSDLGVGSYILRARAAGSHSEVQSALSLNTVSTIIGMAIFIGTILLVLRDSPLLTVVAITVLAVALGLEKNVDTQLAIPIAEGSSGVSAYSILLRRSVSLLGTLSLLALGWNAIVAFSLAYFGGCLIAQVHIQRAIRRSGFSTSVRLTRKIFASVNKTWPFLLAYLAGQLRTIDVALVTAASSSATAGLYGAAFRLSNAVQIVPTAVGQLLMPRAVASEPRFSWIVGKQLTAAAVFLGLLGCSLIPFGSVLLEVLFGRQYANTGLLLFWATEAMIAISLATPLTALLQATGLERAAGVSAMVTTLLMLLGVFLGAAFGGFEGAASVVAVVFAGRCAGHILTLRQAVAR